MERLAEVAAKLRPRLEGLERKADRLLDRAATDVASGTEKAIARMLAAVERTRSIAAIAALYAQAALSCRRVAILDFDVHHGDGTENIVQGREGIEFYSIYQEGIFPHIKQDNHADNIHAYALEAGDTGDDACDIIRSEWGPRLQSFAPDLILISAGFDAHANDTMAQLDFSDLDYAHITRIIKDIAHAVCGGRLVSVLEGGYEPRSLARAVLAHVRTLADL